MEIEKQLITDYLIDNGYNTFPKFVVELVNQDGGVIVFRECEPCEFGDFEQHTVEVLDFVAWVYCKISNSEVK